jgi:hypothetical protein
MSPREGERENEGGWLAGGIVREYGGASGAGVGGRVRWSMVSMMGALGRNDVNHSFRRTASALSLTGHRVGATLLCACFGPAKAAFN